MTKEMLKKAVVDIISEIAPDEDVTNIDNDKPLREQVGLDSMDFLDIVMELRKRFGVDVPEADYMELLTMNSTVNYLYPQMKDM